MTWTASTYSTEDMEKVKNDLNVLMDYIHELAILGAEVLPTIIDAMEGILENRPELKKKFESGKRDSGLKRMKRLWAYTRLATYMANGVQKHYGFPNSDESKELSFPAPELPEDLKEQLRESAPPKEWAEELND